MKNPRKSVNVIQQIFIQLTFLIRKKDTRRKEKKNWYKILASNIAVDELRYVFGGSKII